MQIFRDSFIIQYFWGFIALYILNCSVDAPDVYAESVAEDLSYNDQESIIEIFIETVMGFDDAITEYDDNDENKELLLKKNTFSGYFEFSEYAAPGPAYFSGDHKIRFYKYQPLFSLIFSEVQSPPPEV